MQSYRPKPFQPNQENCNVWRRCGILVHRAGEAKALNHRDESYTQQRTLQLCIPVRKLL